ncbi:Transketolase, pyrimidine binding domain-containing protein [Aspergillus avenaceus]|uniref:2-oxoglutarate dehydrogenase, mitochondrial n=1 Tax=Aspergillus avenaceus TaxID=36643 RepID=A0A5N6TPL6_ASPAV|nr:Transketolase, pyrimidine binding domain-containing protein [Aspergillus avenaceus]
MQRTPGRLFEITGKVSVEDIIAKSGSGWRAGFNTAVPDLRAKNHNDSFLQGNAATYIDMLYAAWKDDPSSGVAHRFLEKYAVSCRASFEDVTATNVPEGFELHKNLERILARRNQTIDTGKDIDWATAEALAFGSLLREGTTVRFSGQDVERGTFSQRHAVLHDQKSNQTYTPLKTLEQDQGLFSITNSSLTENAAMGFEYGYSLADPNALVMWEAQFGDFSNNAQCIIDDYIASSEQKWLQRSGVVLSLPHGYDGQGPEHTSARLERFLQLGNEDSRNFPTPEQLKRQYQDCNMQVVCMTSPANYSHVLRRQIRRDLRKRMLSFPIGLSNRIDQFKRSIDYPLFHVMSRIDVVLQKTENHGDKRVRYAGREPSSSVAVGYKVLHALEEQRLLKDAFQVV